MTRTPTLLTLLSVLLATPLASGCATARSQRPEVRRARALMNESRAHYEAGELTASSASLREAARVVPPDALDVQLDIAERLMEDTGDFELADEMVARVLERARGTRDAGPRARAEALQRRKHDRYRYGQSARLGPCLSISDRDWDGYGDDEDSCPDEPEDFDSFEDDDGCPDRDNDDDGVLDADELEEGDRTYSWTNNDGIRGEDGSIERDCRNEPEDLDGFDDDDGCPDPDNDNDNNDNDNESVGGGAAPDSPSGAREQILQRFERAGALPSDVLARLRRRH